MGMPILPPALRKLLYGNPFGETYPPKVNPAPLSYDGRTACLRVLRQYVSALTFYRAGGVGAPPVPFKVQPKNFHIEQPDHEGDTAFPSIAVLGARADYNTIGLVSFVEERSRDRFGQGTVLQWQSEYTEKIQLEIWSSMKAERRAVLAGLEVAFTPTEQMSGLRFRVPEYYDQLVCFTLARREIMDDQDSARGRRRAQLEVEMRFNVVALVNYLPLRVQTQLSVDVDDQGVSVDGALAGDPNAQVVDG